MRARGLLVRVKERSLYASAAERNIIERIQRDPQTVVAKSIRELADETYTSPSTVVRLCRKLGCEGYKAFQRELVFELALAGKRNDVALDEVSPGDVAEQVIEKVLRSTMRSIDATRQLLDPQTLDRCAGLIVNARVIDLFGIGASLLVAHDLEMKLTRVDRECHAYDDWHNQLLCARNMHPDDLAIVISYSGMTGEMIECARCARERGAIVIAITRAEGETALARHADYVLGVASSEPLVRSGAMASRMSQLAVVDALYAVYVARDYERCTSNILRNYIEKEESARRF